MGSPITYVDGQGPITDWEFNGTDLLRAYLDNVLVFVKAIGLRLPCNPNYTSLNLRDFIDARNPNNSSVVTVYLDAGCSHPTINTGNLTGLNVVLKINGSLESGSYNSPALKCTSSLLLEINGHIRAAGGAGGKGGKGGVGASTSKHITGAWSSEQWDMGIQYDRMSCNSPWVGWMDCSQMHAWSDPWQPQSPIIFWNGTKSVYADTKCRTNTIDEKYEYARGGFHCWAGMVGTGTANHGRGHFKSSKIKRRLNYDKNEVGGSGGAGGSGGKGQYYKNPATNGSAGSGGAPGDNPEATRGGKGGVGGKGGAWGATGAKGATGARSGSAGSNGFAPLPPAISGKSYLGTSNLNNVTGSII